MPIFFPFKLFDAADLGPSHYGERHNVHRAGDHHQIAAREIRVDNGAAGKHADRHLPRLHDLRGATAAADIEKLNVKAVLAENSRFIGNPNRRLGAADGAIGQAQFFQRRLSPGHRRQREKNNKPGQQAQHHRSDHRPPIILPDLVAYIIMATTTRSYVQSPRPAFAAGWHHVMFATAARDL